MRHASWKRSLAGLAVVSVLALGLSSTARGAEDLSGTWKIDKEASDAPPKKAEGQRPDGPPPEGAKPPGGKDGKKGKPGRLGPTFSVEQSGTALTITNKEGDLVREITFGTAPAAQPSDVVPVMSGQWKGSLLEVTATDPRGRKYVESWSLSDGGKTLTIAMQRPARGDKPASTMRRVYRKSAA